MTDDVVDTPTIQLEPSWKQQVGDYLLQPQMRELSTFLRQRKAAGAAVFPPGPQIFAAFDATPFEQVKVVILGQDPYHGRGQAHGLSFSVPAGVPVPPSLLNIYKEIEGDLGIPRPDHGCLVPWAQRGVLLLNAVLTVEEGRAGAHQGRGWEGFTDHVVDVLNREREGLVFMLWGGLRAAEGQGHRYPAPPCAESPASLAAVGPSWLPRLPAFLDGQRLSAASRAGADRLVAAAARGALTSAGSRA